jgi:hypothetical protein
MSTEPINLVLEMLRAIRGGSRRRIGFPVKGEPI